MSERCDNNMFQFTKSCMVGVEQIDTEHQYLFEVMNNLMDVLQNTTDVKQEKAQLEEYIPVLIDYGENHFKHEEAYMESIQDAELPRQKREHASFLSKMRSIDLADLDFAEKKVLMEDVLKYTIRWLYRHILNSDTLIGKVHHLKKDEETFSYCVFSSKYYTGIKAIDEEHERLFDIINEAYTLVEEQYNENAYDDIMHVLDALEEYTQYHFSHEEEYMEKIHYPGLEEQRRAHTGFLERLAEKDLGEIEENHQQFLEEMLDFLYSWLSHHILGMDQNIGKYHS